MIMLILKIYIYKSVFIMLSEKTPGIYDWKSHGLSIYGEKGELIIN